jgi:hypothetical protein
VTGERTAGNEHAHEYEYEYEDEQEHANEYVLGPEYEDGCGSENADETANEAGRPSSPFSCSPPFSLP